MAVDYSGTRADPRLDLGEAFREVDLDAMTYVGLEILKPFSAPKRDGIFAKIRREDMLRQRGPDGMRRASGTGYNRDSFSAEDQTYNCLEYGLEALIADDEREFYASDFDAEVEAAAMVRSALLRDQENRIAGQLDMCGTSAYNQSNFSTTAASASWGTATTDVVRDVQDSIERVRVVTGMIPDTMVIEMGAWRDLLVNDDVRDMVKYTSEGTIDKLAAALAPVFGVQRILIGNVIGNSAAEGATFASVDTWLATVCGLFVTASGGLQTSGVGRTMMWVDDAPSNEVFESYRDESRRSDVIRVRQFVDELVIDVAMGDLIDIT